MTRIGPTEKELKEKERRRKKEEERKRKAEERKRKAAERPRRVKISKTPNIVPGRVAVGPDYHLASGIVRSRTQLDRLRADGRVTFFNIGSRLAQWRDVADAELAALIEQPESNAA